MIDRINKAKTLFKNGKLNVRDGVNSFTISYTNRDRIKISKIFQKKYYSMSDVQGFMIDIYFEYEYDSILSDQEIATLLGMEVYQVKHFIKKILQKTKIKALKTFLY